MPKQTQQKVSKNPSIKYKTKHMEEKEVFLDIIQQVGPWNIVPAKFARERDIPVRTVESWKQKWMREEYQDYLKKFVHSGRLTFIAAYRTLSTGLAAQDSKERRQAAKDIIDATDKFLKGCESFGVKLEGVQLPQEAPQTNTFIFTGDLKEELSEDVQEQIVKLVQTSKTIKK